MTNDKFRATAATVLSVTLASNAIGTPAFADELLDGEGLANDVQITAPVNPDEQTAEGLFGGGEPSGQRLDDADLDDDGKGPAGGTEPGVDVEPGGGAVTEPGAGDQSGSEQPDDSDYGLSGTGSEDYEGKQSVTETSDGVLVGKDSFHAFAYTDENGVEQVVYYPIANRNQRQFDILPSSIQALYEFDEALGLYVPKVADDQWNDPAVGYDWDCVFTYYAESSRSGDILFNYGDSQGVGSGDLLRLHGMTGRIVYAYCMDASTYTSMGALYSVNNVRSADYIPGDEAQQKAALEHISAAARLGYWGSESGIGSLALMKEQIKNALINGMPINFTFMGVDGDVDNAKPITYTSQTEEGLSALLALVDDITEGEALSATQAAIWQYGDCESDAVESITFGVASGSDTPNSVEARMELVRAYLTSDYARNFVLTANEGSTVITNEFFLAEDGINLSVGDKIEGLAENMDNDPDNDVFNTDVSFKLIASPNEKDELIVSLIDANGVVVRQAHVGKNADSNCDDFVYENGTFTFKDVQLAENANLSFNLKIEGVQYLEQGVYMLKSTKGFDEEQTLISLLCGGVDIEPCSATMLLNFDVDDESPSPSDDPGMGPEGGDDPYPGDKPDGAQEPGATPDSETTPSAGTIMDLGAEAPRADAATPETGDAYAASAQAMALLAGAALSMAFYSRRRRA